MCEECGEPNFCADLGDPKSHTSEAPPRAGELERYSLALHELMPDVEAHHRLGRVPARVRELAARLAGRERLDMAITHPADWGVAPADSAVADDQVIWVWIDMAYRFLYGIEALGRAHGEDWRADRPDPDWKIVHFLGYDNTFYHAVFCPALYKLAHPEWTPDIDYHLNEFYELDFDKFSTSRRHAVWGKDVLDPETVDAVRFHLSRTRPEGRRTNFTTQEFEKTFDEVLIGTWQAWLDDLGTRLDAGYDGVVPDAGIWTPEHTAFHARLGRRLEELTNALGQDGFSLNRAAEALAGIVEDTLVFSRAERAAAGLPGWKDEARTAIALELAAARLRAFGAAPVMPRFAAKLALALGQGDPDEWPELVRLVAPGTRAGLTGRVYFGAAPESPAEPSPDSAELPWLSALIRESLQLDAALPVADRTLVELGMTSMQCIALQYQILEKLDVDVSVETLLGARTVGSLAAYLEAGAASGSDGADSAADGPECAADPAGTAVDGGPRP
jgi:methionyl-tRNA synthetase